MCAWEFNQQSQQQPKGLIYIGIPYKQNFSAKAVQGFLSLQFPEGYAHMISMITGQPVDNARNITVSNALQNGATHIFFVDEDVNLKHNTLTLLKEANMPIVGAVYYKRNPPYDVCANINQNALTRQQIAEKRGTSPDGKGLMEVHELGFGAILVDIRVFHRVAQIHNLPWFCMNRHPGQLDSLEKNDSGIYFDYIEAIELKYRCKYCNNTLVCPFFDYRLGKYSEDALSEDYYFLKLARNCGFSVYLSLHTEVPHEITSFTIDSDGLTNSTTSAGVA